MTSPLLTRRRLVGFTKETTKGTAETVDAAIAAAIYDAKLEPVDFTADGERRPGGHVGRAKTSVGPKKGRLTFRMEVAHGDGILHELLELCGCVLNTGGTVASMWASVSEQSTGTFALWEDGRKKMIRGAIGNAKLMGESGKRVFAEFEFTGAWVPCDDEEMPAYTPVNTIGYRFVGATITLAATALPCLDKFELDLGNQISDRKCASDTSGFSYFSIDDRGPTLTLDPEARTVADRDVYGKLEAMTLEALVLSIPGPSSGDELLIAAPKAQHVEVTDEDRDGKAIDAIKLELQASSGNDELTITENT